MIEEIWKKVRVDFEVRYNVEVSNLGNVRKINDNGDYVYYGKPVNSRGYPQIGLYNIDGKRKIITVHKIVAMTFHNKIDGYVVNHKDGNRLNNRADNLEWVTRSYNCKHGSGLMVYTKLKNISSGDTINIINYYMNSAITFNDVVDKFNLSRESVRTIFNKRAKKYLTADVYLKLRKKHISVKIKNNYGKTINNYDNQQSI